MLKIEYQKLSEQKKAETVNRILTEFRKLPVENYPNIFANFQYDNVKANFVDELINRCFISEDQPLKNVQQVCDALESGNEL